MNERLRKFLEANGLRKDATDQETWELYDRLKEDGVELPGIKPGERSVPAIVPPGNGDGREREPAGEREEDDITLTRDEMEAEIARATVRALAADAERRAAVQDIIDAAGVAGLDDGTFARSLLDNPEVTVERASHLVLTELSKRNRPIGVGSHSGVSVGTESREKMRAAVTDGLLLRAGHRLENAADGAREFRGRHLVEICRELLEASGFSCRGMSRKQIVGRALVAGSTSDFPHIFGGLVNSTLQRAYVEWPSTWRPFVAITGANDFKDIHAIRLSASPDLKGLNENGEYQSASFSDAKESYRVITKGITVKLTRQMIINDDLRAFTRIPQLFGAAAKRMESDAVYSLITDNGTMGDGKPLFHSTHRNLGSGAALSSDSLSVARAAMRMQRGMKKERIDIQAAFLLVPVIMETEAEVLLRSTALPEENKSAGVHNPWAGKLEPIADPHLDEASPTAWYTLAHPNQAPLIEAAFLEGEEQPYVEEMVDFDSDALKIKVRHDFGAGVVDHIGGYKNPGA